MWWWKTCLKVELTDAYQTQPKTFFCGMHEHIENVNGKLSFPLPPVVNTMGYLIQRIIVTDKDNNFLIRQITHLGRARIERREIRSEIRLLVVIFHALNSGFTTKINC
ncbi:hypothetical protein DTJ15_03575 [Parasaccharibacter sp. TMW 2.1891]|nr:hypothetical protein [Parasaccharibacter sp. TMW 2.1891]